MAGRTTETGIRHLNDALRQAVERLFDQYIPPPPPHYCGRCMVLFITRGDYILHVCGGPPGECLSRIDREPFGVVYPGGGPIVRLEDFGFSLD